LAGEVSPILEVDVEFHSASVNSGAEEVQRPAVLRCGERAAGAEEGIAAVPHPGQERGPQLLERRRPGIAVQQVVALEGPARRS
jgi:hypothetical protein